MSKPTKQLKNVSDLKKLQAICKILLVIGCCCLLGSVVLAWSFIPSIAQYALLSSFILAIPSILLKIFYRFFKAKRICETDRERSIERQLIDDLPVAVWSKKYDKSRAGTFTLWNKEAESLWGLKKEDVIGKTDFEIYSQSEARSHTREDSNLFKNNSHIESELAFVEDTKIFRWKKTIGSDHVFCVAKKTSEVEALQEEVENQRLALVQSSKLAVLGELSSGIAHEINNPLVIIQGYTEYIKSICLSSNNANNADISSVPDYCERIEKTLIRIRSIVDGLRNMSRDGESDPFEVVNLHSVIEETIEFCKSKFRSLGVKLEYSQPEKDISVQCRRVQVSQALLNLLNNAGHASKDSAEKLVWVQISSCDRMVSIFVKDSGKGIPESIRNKLFNPYFTTKKVGEGTGLGLSISKKLISDQKGELLLKEYQEGQPTTFVINLPKDSAISPGADSCS